MEVQFRRLTERSWEGELHGYLVYIGEQGDQCYVWLMPGGQWTERCLRVGSLPKVARLARAWIEERDQVGAVMPK